MAEHDGAGPGQRRRTIGRIRVIQVFAGPMRSEATIDGCEVERRWNAGTVEVVAFDGEGTPLGIVRVHADAHGDPFYGRYSSNDESYVYGSKLEIAPAARGRGLGVQLLRVARSVAFDETGRGLKGLVAPDNDISLRVLAHIQTRLCANKHSENKALTLSVST